MQPAIQQALGQPQAPTQPGQGPDQSQNPAQMSDSGLIQFITGLLMVHAQASQQGAQPAQGAPTPPGVQ